MITAFLSFVHSKYDDDDDSFKFVDMPMLQQHAHCTFKNNNKKEVIGAQFVQI